MQMMAMAASRYCTPRGQGAKKRAKTGGSFQALADPVAAPPPPAGQRGAHGRPLPCALPRDLPAARGRYGVALSCGVDCYLCIERLVRCVCVCVCVV